MPEPRGRPAPPDVGAYGLEADRSALRTTLAECGSAVVALSGGVDSATLAVLSHLALGERSLAVTGVSASLSRHQKSLVEKCSRSAPDAA